MHAVANAKIGLPSTFFYGNIAWLSAAVHWGHLEEDLPGPNLPAGQQSECFGMGGARHFPKE
jgi:hypothetical protein